MSSDWAVAATSAPCGRFEAEQARAGAVMASGIFSRGIAKMAPSV